MKTIIAICALLMTVLNSYGQADYLGNQDTRLINDAPAFFKTRLRMDFKSSSVIGAPGTGNYTTVLTIAPWADNSGGKNHQLGFNNGGLFYRTGSHLSPTWDSWQKLVIEDANGNVGIGTTTPTTKLAVNGNIRAREIKVEVINWPDFVFAKDYALPTLQETENHIKEKGHLPGIPSAAEVQANGVELGEMNKKLLQKIEELTLHLIHERRLIDTIQRQMKDQQRQISRLTEKNENTK